MVLNDRPNGREAKDRQFLVSGFKFAKQFELRNVIDIFEVSGVTLKDIFPADI